MSALQSAIENKDTDLLKVLVNRRLGGDHLDVPINGSLGEQPRNVIKELFVEEENQSVITETLRMIIHDDAQNIVDDLGAVEIHESTGSWLLQLLNLLVEVSYEDPDGSLVKLCSNISKLDLDNEITQTVGATAFTVYLLCVKGPKKNAQAFFSPALSNHETAELYSLAAATSDPCLFLLELAPQILTHYEDKDLEEGELNFLTNSLREAFDCLTDHDTAHSDPIEIFLKRAATRAPLKGGHEIRNSIVRALSLSKCSAKKLQEFEQKYWDTFPASEIFYLDSLSIPREKLKEYVIERCGEYPEQSPSSLSMNTIPYAENGLLKLHELLLNIAYDIPIIRKSIRYSMVKKELLNGGIDLAVHNPMIMDQIPFGAEHDIKIYKSNCEIIEFTGYDILINRRGLLEILSSANTSDEAKRLAKKLLDEENLEQLVKSDPEMGQSFLELINIGRISFLRNTDTENVVLSIIQKNQGIKEIDVNVIDDVGPDEGLERLLDNKVLFYIGGALQANYGLNACPNRVLNASHIKQDTSLSFYTTSDNWEKRQELILLCGRVWRAVYDVWELLLKDLETVEQELRPILEVLKTELVMSVNRDRSMRNGFLPSFDALKNMVDTHDKIICVEPSIIRFQTLEKNVALDVVNENVVADRASNKS